MHRVDTSGNIANLFDDGDPDVPREATVVDKHILNAFQEEICHVVETAGIALVKDTNTQLYAAILKIIGSPPTFTYPALHSGVTYVSHLQKLGYWLDANGAVHIDGTVKFAELSSGPQTIWDAGTLTSYLTTDGDIESNVAFMCVGYDGTPRSSAECATVPCIARIRYDGRLEVIVAADEKTDGGTSVQHIYGVDIHIVYHPVLAIQP